MPRRERERAFSDSEDEELVEDDDDDDGSEATPARLKVKIDSKFLGNPKPWVSKARKGASGVWAWLRGLVRGDGHPFKGDGTTHLCVYPLENGSACNTELTLNKANKTSASLSTTNAQKHFSKAHPDSNIAKKRKDTQVARQLGMNSVAAGSPGGEVGSPQQPPAGPTKTCPTCNGKGRVPVGPGAHAFTQGSLLWNQRASPDQLRLAGTRAYIYSRCALPLSVFDDPYVRTWLTLVAGGTLPTLPNRKNIPNWVESEFQLFLSYLKWILGKQYVKAQGNRFAQVQHDGCTFANGKKYNAVAIQFMDFLLRCNHVVCLGVGMLRSGKDAPIADLIDEMVSVHP